MSRNIKRLSDTVSGGVGLVDTERRVLTTIKITFVWLVIALSLLHGVYLLMMSGDAVDCVHKLLWMAAGNAVLFSATFVILRIVLKVILMHGFGAPPELEINSEGQSPAI